jgi:putative colanic acid biosynthesis UDP-glucose lipid carrier transferase
MVAQQTGRYSKYIRPISITIDILVITILSLYFFRDLNLNMVYYIAYQTLAWIFIAFLLKFYEVYRFTTPVEIISKIFKQFSLFILVVIAFFPFAKTVIFSGKAIAIMMTISFVIIAGIKYFLFFYLKKYRITTKNNFRNAILFTINNIDLYNQWRFNLKNYNSIYSTKIVLTSFFNFLKKI